MPDRRRLLVLGLGNLLCSDDGVGVYAVRQLLARYRPGPRVEVLDGGTLGLALLGYLGEADDAVLVDAIAAEDPPGSLVRLSGEEVVPAVRDRLSVHQIGVFDLLLAARLIGAEPGRLRLVGLVPDSVELGCELSTAVAAGLDPLVEAVASEVRELGYGLTRRQATAVVAAR